MLSKKKLLRHLLMGAVSCVLLMTLSVSSLGHKGIAMSPTWSALSSGMPVSSIHDVKANLNAAKSALMAQGMPGEALVSYVAVLNDQNVVPVSPTTSARGAVGAVLVGDRLIVRGNFGGLSSPMRNYATDPVDPPNPNITSAFHIHRGAPTENGPFQYALDVRLDDSGRSGSAMGEYTLTEEQLQALANGMLYVDLHTTMNRGGELRGILMPY